MKSGLWANIWAKRRRGERMRKPGEKGAPTADALKRARETSESIKDTRPDHEIMRGAMGDARRKHDAKHGHGAYDKLPNHHKEKLHHQEIKQRFADIGRKPPKYSSKLTVTKNGKTTTHSSRYEDATTTASIPNPADTAMGPRLKTTSVTDRRRRKDQVPVLLKRFRKYMEDQNVN